MCVAIVVMNLHRQENLWKIDACHPERSEGSRQFLVLQRFTYNCGDPSLHSGWQDPNFFTLSVARATSIWDAAHGRLFL